MVTFYLPLHFRLQKNQNLAEQKCLHPFNSNANLNTRKPLFLVIQRVNSSLSLIFMLICLVMEEIKHPSCFYSYKNFILIFMFQKIIIFCHRDGYIESSFGISLNENWNFIINLIMVRQTKNLLFGGVLGMIEPFEPYSALRFKSPN